MPGFHFFSMKYFARVTAVIVNKHTQILPFTYTSIGACNSVLHQFCMYLIIVKREQHFLCCWRALLIFCLCSTVYISLPIVSVSLNQVLRWRWPMMMVVYNLIVVLSVRTSPSGRC